MVACAEAGFECCPKVGPAPQREQCELSEVCPWHSHNLLGALAFYISSWPFLQAVFLSSMSGVLEKMICSEFVEDPLL